MRKTGKVMLWVAAALVVFGVALLAIAFAKGGKFWMSTDMNEKRVSFSAAEVKNVVLETTSDAVVVLPATDGTVEVVTMENDDHCYEVVLEDGTLNIRCKSGKEWYGFFNIRSWFAGKQTVTVTLPAELAGELALHTVSGEIRAQGIAAGGAVKISSTSGTLQLEQMSASEDISLSSTSGATRCENVQTKGALSCLSTSGAVSLTDVRADGSLRVQSVSGGASLTRTQAGGDVSVGSTSGSLNFAQLKGRNFKFNSVSGGISGTIAENGRDYTADAGSVSGSVRVTGAGSGSRTLKASTTSGGISIEFIG